MKSKKPKNFWDNDLIQFARLIAELEGCGGFCNRKVKKELCENMDLTKDELFQIVERA